MVVCVSNAVFSPVLCLCWCSVVLMVSVLVEGGGNTFWKHLL